MGGIRSIEMPTGKSTLLAVELPEGISGELLINDGTISQTLGWQHIGTLDKMTEEDWKGIVEVIWNGYKNYEISNEESVGNYQRLVKSTPTESGLSLLKMNGADKFDRNRTHFFIKQD